VKDSALIFAHSDADGHLAAVQTKEHLLDSGCKTVHTFVDRRYTRNWTFWENAFQAADFGDASLVVVVDLMFKPQDPESSLEALFYRAKKERKRSFIVIDHHSYSRHISGRNNVRIDIVPSVYQCCLGPPSDLMLVASICDKDEQPVKALLSLTHHKRALGMKRAVTDVDGFAGPLTLRLLEQRYWQIFENLADEPADYHRTFYGNRIDRSPRSPLLMAAHALRAESTASKMEGDRVLKQFNLFVARAYERAPEKRPSRMAAKINAIFSSIRKGQQLQVKATTKTASVVFGRKLHSELPLVVEDDDIPDNISLDRDDVSTHWFE